MAKENYALLVGELQGSPIVNENKQKAQFTIKTLRRNDKIDYPVIMVLDESLLEEVKVFEEGDFILIKGMLSTSEVKKGSYCPHCGSIVKKDGTTTEILAIEILNIGKSHTIEALKEISNTIILLGALCREPEYRILENSGVASTQYQIAVNRKYNVKRQQDSLTDHPWVNSFGKQAEQDAVRLQSGSQVLINGGIQTRNIQKTVVCDSCNQEFKAMDHVSEIVPYSVEYLNNCKFE